MKIHTYLCLLYVVCISFIGEKLYSQSLHAEQLQTTIDAIIAKKMKQYDILHFFSNDSIYSRL